MNFCQTSRRFDQQNQVIYKMFKKAFITAALLTTALAQPAWAQSDQPIPADGRAPMVGKNPNRDAVMNAALDDARTKVVKSLLNSTLGLTQAGKVTPEQLQFLKEQISPSAIHIDGIPRVVNGELVISVIANIDRNWFRDQIRAADIDTSADQAEEVATVVMMIDFTEGTTRDLNAPSSVVTDYSSSKGASYSDQSIAASSEKSKEASSERSAEGTSVRGSAAAAASGYYGAAAARSGYSGSAASMSKSASASSYSNAQVQKNNVQAEVHDDVNFHQAVANKDSTPVFNDEQEAITSVSQVAQKYGVGFTPINRFSSTFFGGRAPKWATLKDDFRFNRFLEYLNSQKVNFFASGTLNVVQLGASDSGNYVRCSGTLNVQIVPTKGLGNLPAAAPPGDTANGISAEDCRAKLVTKLSVQAGEELGTKIQEYWRKVSKKAAAADAVKEQQKYALTEAGADYTLSFSSGAGLDYMAARQIGQLLPTIPGVDKVARQSLTDKQVVYLVHYQGKDEVDGLIMDKLMSVQALANFRPAKVNGTSLDFCSGSCN